MVLSLQDVSGTQNSLSPSFVRQGCYHENPVQRVLIHPHFIIVIGMSIYVPFQTRQELRSQRNRLEHIAGDARKPVLFEKAVHIVSMLFTCKFTGHCDKHATV